VFKDRIMGRLFGLNREKPTTGWRKLHKWAPNSMIFKR
jgi:hypothetical protein